jgi:nucleotide-binding universal stress UspA family protein
MEKILLAIDGTAPDGRILSYAVALCKRMRAGLDILQILGPQTFRKYLKMAKQGTLNARSAFEDAMVAATFAEVGQHGTAEQLRTHASAKLNRLIPERERDGIEYQLTLKSGNPGEEIVRYVHDHRNVVLTIFFDAGATDARVGASENKTDTVRQIEQKLATPLVVMREM